MRVIIEGYCYRASAVRDVLHELSTLENVGGEISVGYVGYYYNPQLKDCVFILPKVLVNEENKVFSRLDPHDIIDLDNCKLLTSEERSFIYEFAVWIYRAIEVFNKSNPNSGIVLHRKIAEMGKGKRVLSNTFLDILLSLLRFNKEHYSFFTTILRNLHSGYNKINWTRTISRSTAWVQNDVPVYLNPVNKKRQINTDEELIIIYFSILNHISETYGFPVDITLGFELIKGRKFEHYLKGYGKRRLKQIKYRYFSDIQLRLWELCYAFFDKAHQIHIVAEQREYLLVKSFNIVFEAIIDELIGDKDVPRGLKDQVDGKRVDHIYSYRNLTNNEGDKPIYYIGDSKYYKLGNKVSAESVYKQFTYARNVIQWNLNLFLDESKENIELQKRYPKYRDEQTEGYNIIPNFFISAKMDEKLSYADNVSTTNRENNTFLSRHLYARENKYQKAQWKANVRKLFREKIQDALEEKYKFYAMTPKPGLNHEKYLRENFQELLGKVYRPFDDTNYLSLALDQKEDNDTLLTKLQKDYYVVECPLGKNPTSVLSGEKAQNSSEAVHGRKGVLMVMMEKYATKSANFSHGKLAVAIKMTVESMDIVENLSNIGYVLFHHRSDNDQHLFSVKGTCIIKAAGELEDDRYKNIGNKELYISVDIDTTELPNDNLHASMIKPASKETRYDAQFAWLSDLESDNSKVAE